MKKRRTENPIRRFEKVGPVQRLVVAEATAE